MPITSNPLTQEDVARICGMSPDSTVCARSREMLTEIEAERAERKRENDRLRAARLQREAEAKKTKEAEREKARAADRERVMRELHDAFRTANPEASERDWESIAEDLYRARLIERTTTQRDAEIERLRRTGMYRVF
jgi:transcriptional regulator with XRE-family HTH domain